MNLKAFSEGISTGDKQSSEIIDKNISIKPFSETIGKTSFKEDPDWRNKSMAYWAKRTKLNPKGFHWEGPGFVAGGIYPKGKRIVQLEKEFQDLGKTEQNRMLKRAKKYGWVGTWHGQGTEDWKPAKVKAERVDYEKYWLALSDKFKKVLAAAVVYYPWLDKHDWSENYHRDVG